MQKEKIRLGSGAIEGISFSHIICSQAKKLFIADENYIIVFPQEKILLIIIH